MQHPHEFLLQGLNGGKVVLRPQKYLGKEVLSKNIHGGGCKRLSKEMVKAERGSVWSIITVLGLGNSGWNWGYPLWSCVTAWAVFGSVCVGLGNCRVCCAGDI